MKYFKSLGFYFCEWLGSTINLLCSLLGLYPSFDLGVRFLLGVEAKRIRGEQIDRQNVREDNEERADVLKSKAEADG